MRTFSGSALLTVGGLVFLLSCDPGYHYRPNGWEQDGDGWWRKDMPTFRVRMRPPGGLIGTTFLDPEPEFTNRAEDPLVIVGATLATEGSHWEATLPGHGELQWRTIGPGESRRVGLYFDLGKPLYEAVGKRVTVRLLYRHGKGPTETLEVVCDRE